jgi:hypothetical protein
LLWTNQILWLWPSSTSPRRPTCFRHVIMLKFYSIVSVF